MKTVFVWCECRTVYPKNERGCPACGTPPRHQVSVFGARRQATALMGARAASNLNAQAAHAKYET